jgi:MFS transporter, MHS family, alpha-ketoglutarate permease
MNTHVPRAVTSTNATRDRASSAPPEQPRSVRKTLMATGVGNAVEWFDWAIYATFASYIAHNLFSPSDPSSAFMSTLAIFAVGFLARPLGGLLFGWLGDRVGRKFSMTLCVGLASVGSLLIGIAPNYSSAGAWASVTLLTARLIQGLAHGGELPSAQTYLSETAPAERRGLWSSLIYFSGTCGNLVGTLIGAILASTLDAEAMNAWGWRLPFLLGAVLGLVGLIMRSTMHESEVFTAAVHEGKAGKTSSLARELRTHWRSALRVIGLTVGLTVSYYVWAISAPAYAINQLHFSASGALWAGVVANVVFIVSLPLWGMASDKFGRRPIMMVSGLGAAALYFPASTLLKDQAWQLAVAMTLMLVFIGASASIVPAIYSELFPTSVRTVGVALPYALTVAAFGGTAAYLQAGMNQWFGAQGPTMFGIYAVVLLLTGVVTAATMPETKGKDLSAT